MDDDVDLDHDIDNHNICQEAVKDDDRDREKIEMIAIMMMIEILLTDNDYDNHQDEN